MEHIFDENIQQMPKDFKQYKFYKKLIHAVYVHRRAVELVLVYIIPLHSKPILPGLFDKPKLLSRYTINMNLFT